MINYGIFKQDLSSGIGFKKKKGGGAAGIRRNDMVEV
jgi:hypothetical protein